MEKLTYNDIVSVLERKANLHDLCNNEADTPSELGSVEVVAYRDVTSSEDKFGDDDLGESVAISTWTVYHFVDHDIFVKVQGWLSSYSGIEFDQMYQVVPTIKTITVYEKI